MRARWGVFAGGMHSSEDGIRLSGEYALFTMLRVILFGVRLWWSFWIERAAWGLVVPRNGVCSSGGCVLFDARVADPRVILLGARL